MSPRPRHLIERATERLLQSGTFDRVAAGAMLGADALPHHSDAGSDEPSRYFYASSQLHPSAHHFLWSREVAPVLARLLAADTARQNEAVVAHVTAVAPGDGASTVARQLAYAAGRLAWCRALLLDAHPEDNDQSACLGGPLPDLLCEQTAAGRAEIAVVESGNAVFHAAVLPPVFSAQAMSAMIALRQKLAATYHLVVVDSPPILKEPYLAPVSALPPKVVLVLRAGETRVSLALRVKHEIEGLGAELFGAVLTHRKQLIPHALDALL